MVGGWTWCVQSSHIHMSHRSCDESRSKFYKYPGNRGWFFFALRLPNNSQIPELHIPESPNLRIRKSKFRNIAILDGNSIDYCRCRFCCFHVFFVKCRSLQIKNSTNRLWIYPPLPCVAYLGPEGECKSRVENARKEDQEEIVQLRQIYEQLQASATHKERENLRVLKQTQE